jgi:SPP1 gp7 family putative phage head morphogenesis protein
MLLLDDKYSTLAAQLYYAIENALVGDLAIPVAQQTIMSIFGFSPFGEQYAATILDTAMATAWNTARMQSYAELENAAGTSSVDIVGYQFLAVMDEYTTEQCAELHDEYFKADDPSLPRPPLHFNCRSQLVPVFGDQREGVNWMTPEQSRAQVSGMVAAGQIQKGFGGV